MLGQMWPEFLERVVQQQQSVHEDYPAFSNPRPVSDSLKGGISEEGSQQWRGLLLPFSLYWPAHAAWPAFV